MFINYTLSYSILESCTSYVQFTCIHFVIPCSGLYKKYDLSQKENKKRIRLVIDLVKECCLMVCEKHGTFFQEVMLFSDAHVFE